MNKKISIGLIGFSLAIMLSTVVIKILYGHGQNNPTFILTGFYNGHLFIFGLLLFFLTLLVNNHTRTIILEPLVNRDDQNHLWLHNHKIKNGNFFICINYILFGLLSIYYFDRVKETSLFLGVDGDYTLSLNSQIKIWADSLFSYGANFFQGMGGNITFVLNTLLDPGFQIGNMAETFSIPAAHTVWALLLFTSTFILTRAVKLNTICAILAAWLASCLILFPSPFQIAAVPTLIPWVSISISLTLLMIALVVNNSNTIIALVTRSVFLSLIVVYFSVHYPLYLFLSFPLVAVTALTKFFIIDAREDRIKEFFVFVAPIIFFAFSGVFEFILGLFLNTAVHFFPKDFAVPAKTNNSISILFFSPMSAVICSLSFLGILSTFIVRKKPIQLKVLTISIGIITGLIFGLGFFYVSYPQIWNGPSPNYFEFMSWPIYAIFLSYFFLRILSCFSAEKLPVSWLKSYFISNYSPYLIPIVAVLIFLSLRDVPNSRYWDFPPPASPIMEELMVLSHQPGDPFKGRLATFTGLNIEHPVDWMDLQKLDTKEFLTNFDNDFRKAGLWINGIPTLTEYSPLISPRFYYFTRNVFARTEDMQTRNMMVLREINPTYLKLMGVRLIITDSELEGYKLLAQEKTERTEVFLYSLSQPNIGQYSPTEIVPFTNVENAMQIIKSRTFDPTKQILVQQPLEDLNPALEDLNLVPALLTKMTVGINKYVVSAKSVGKSILLLPIEYSDCFDFEAQSSGSISPKLFPGNIMFIAILFVQDLNVTLSYKNGPFTNQSCRLNDYRAFKALLKRKLN
jgi:hypothetical protein